MTNISKIQNNIKRKVNELRVRNTVGDILDDALPGILTELKKEEHPHDLPPDDKGLEELDVRKTHGDKRIENPATGNDIKLRTALKAKKGSAVYAKGKAMYNALKDTPANESVKGKLERLKELLATDVNERAYASTDGKPYFDYDPGEGKLTEAEEYKYKKYVAKAFNKINDEMFKFRHAMGVKQLTQKDSKLKNKVESMQQAIFNLQKEMKSKGLTEGKLTEAKIKKGDVIKMQDGEIGVVNKVKGRVAYIKLPSSPGSFHPIEADRTTYKGKHKGKDIYSETKSAPAGHYFTKGGNVVKGRLSKAARTKGATKSDPKDKQRSKVPPATQRNESAKDKFGAPPMNKWWTGDKDALMSAIYHAQRQLPPSNKAAYDKNWKNIVKQLQKKFPASTAIYRKRLEE